MGLTQFFDQQHEPKPRRRRLGFGPVILFWIAVAAFACAVQNVHCADDSSSTTRPPIVITSSPVHKTSTSSTLTVTAKKSSSDKKKYVVVAQKDKKVEPEPEKWNSWLPMPPGNITAELLMPTPNTTPLTVAEQEKRTKLVNTMENKKKQEIADLIAKDKMKYQQSAAKPIIVNYDKWSLDSIQDQVFTYGRMLMENFLSGVQSSNSKGKESKSRGKSNPLPPTAPPAAEPIPVPLPAPVDQSAAGSAPVPATRYSSFGHYGQTSPPAAPSPIPDSFSSASNNLYSAAQAAWPAYATAQNIYTNYGGEAKSVVNWLARLIGVSGKTLGEFLREYQVHVLYDLVFTFFKWIFFLYAGLLIP